MARMLARCSTREAVGLAQSAVEYGDPE